MTQYYRAIVSYMWYWISSTTLVPTWRDGIVNTVAVKNRIVANYSFTATARLLKLYVLAKFRELPHVKIPSAVTGYYFLCVLSLNSSFALEKDIYNYFFLYLKEFILMCYIKFLSHLRKLIGRIEVKIKNNVVKM